ncbi:30S ribosomal protein S21, chloroplastic, partial [Cucurbita argyrosperma subsp. argyrosperma]
KWIGKLIHKSNSQSCELYTEFPDPSMASLSSFFSFLLPSKPPPPKPLQPLIASPSPANQAADQFQTLKSRDGSVALSPQQASKHSEPLSAELASVICPSLAFANTMFFRSAYNVQVIVDDNEPEERLLNRFRREVMRAGVIQECKRRKFFENPHDVKKRKSREAAKRNRRRRPQQRFTPQDKQDVPATKQEADDDNWDLPEEGIPY